MAEFVLVEIGQRIRDTLLLEASVTRELPRNGKGVRCGNCDSKQKRFSCGTVEQFLPIVAGIVGSDFSYNFGQFQVIAEVQP